MHAEFLFVANVANCDKTGGLSGRALRQTWLFTASVTTGHHWALWDHWERFGAFRVLTLAFRALTVVEDLNARAFT
jgi:hypothetical protein